jgi:hypothetical protein
VQVEFREIVGNQQKSLFTTFGGIVVSALNFAFHVAPSLFEGVG